MTQLSHKDCVHAATGTARAKCREERAGRSPRPRRWGGYADGKVYEFTAEEIREIHGGTVAQFQHCLRAYAHNHALKCSARKTENGLKFCMGDGPLTWQAPIGRWG